MTTLAPPALPTVDQGEPQYPRGISRIWRGRPEDPSWARPGLLVLLAVTAVLYLWNLSASGWANAFYSAAAQAGAENGVTPLHRSPVLEHADRWKRYYDDQESA